MKKPHVKTYCISLPLNITISGNILDPLYTLIMTLFRQWYFQYLSRSICLYYVWEGSRPCTLLNPVNIFGRVVRIVALALVCSVYSNADTLPYTVIAAGVATDRSSFWKGQYQLNAAHVPSSPSLEGMQALCRILLFPSLQPLTNFPLLLPPLTRCIGLTSERKWVKDDSFRRDALAAGSIRYSCSAGTQMRRARSTVLPFVSAWFARWRSSACSRNIRDYR